VPVTRAPVAARMPAPVVAKLPTPSLNPSVAQVSAPAVTVGGSENRLEISTYITTVGNVAVLYNGDRMWAKVTLTMRTAGPVAVGQNNQLLPVLSGRGQLLQTGIPTVFNVAKGNRLYIVASAVTPISMVVEAFPWLETITGLAGSASGVVPVQGHISTGKL